MKNIHIVIHTHERRTNRGVKRRNSLSYCISSCIDSTVSSISKLSSWQSISNLSSIVKEESLTQPSSRSLPLKVSPKISIFQEFPFSYPLWARSPCSLNTSPFISHLFFSCISFSWLVSFETCTIKIWSYNNIPSSS
jgi:hypothetical protein